MALPQFPIFAPIELAHADEVREVLDAMERPISEFSFANLYLFRAAHDYRLSRLGGLLLITARGYDGGRYAFPPWGVGDVEEGARKLAAHLAAEGSTPRIYPVPGAMVERFFSSPSWEATRDRDGADYVYSAEKLARLEGGIYHKKKNRLNKYLREVGDSYSYSPLDDSNVGECVALAKGWCEERCDISRPSTFLETEAAVEALIMRRELGLSGGVILARGRVEAYCLGEELNPETFVVHFEKGIPGLDGPAQAINRDFCRFLAGRYKYVNREQDLGDPGLRQAKESYNPEFLAEKFVVRPR